MLKAPGYDDAALAYATLSLARDAASRKSDKVLDVLFKTQVCSKVPPIGAATSAQDDHGVTFARW